MPRCRRNKKKKATREKRENIPLRAAAASRRRRFDRTYVQDRENAGRLKFKRLLFHLSISYLLKREEKQLFPVLLFFAIDVYVYVLSFAFQCRLKTNEENDIPTTNIGTARKTVTLIPASGGRKTNALPN